MAGKIGGVLVIAFLAIGWYARSQLREQVYEEIDETVEMVAERLVELKQFEEHGDFLMETAERAHEVAYEGSVTHMRRRTTFNRERYIELFMRTMINAVKAKFPNDREFDQAIRQMQIDLENS